MKLFCNKLLTSYFSNWKVTIYGTLQLFRKMDQKCYQIHLQINKLHET